MQVEENSVSVTFYEKQQELDIRAQLMSTLVSDLWLHFQESKQSALPMIVTCVWR